MSLKLSLTHGIAAGALIGTLALNGCGGEQKAKVKAAPDVEAKVQENEVSKNNNAPVFVAADIEKRLSNWGQVALDFDDSVLSASDKKVLKLLVEAAEVADDLSRNQIDLRILPLKKEILSGDYSAAAKALFRTYNAPWDQLTNGELVFGDFMRRPEGEFYPHDMTKEEFENFLAANPDKREAFTSYFTVIRRDEAGKLIAVPYSKAYAEDIAKMADLFNQAAEITEHADLKKFLLSRAAALKSDDYMESDGDWLHLDSSPIELTFGPYEVYDDELMNYKAIFEAYVAIKDQEASKQLAQIGTMMEELDKNFPMKEELRTPMRGLGSPISVVTNVYCGGCGGVQTVAFNLPNDEVTRAKFGSKKVMMRNMMDAKYKAILLPIADYTLTAEEKALITPDSFFQFVLLHEVSHGLGPGLITKADGTKSDVNKELKETYPAIEEAKADIGGMYSVAYLEEKGIYPAGSTRAVWAASLAGAFRTVRFGAEEAHSKAVSSSFNFIMDKGGYVYDAEKKRFYVDAEKMGGAVKDLLAVLLELEAKGDYEGAKAFLAKYGPMRPEMVEAIASFQDHVPADIAPSYPILEKMKNW